MNKFLKKSIEKILYFHANPLSYHFMIVYCSSYMLLGLSVSEALKAPSHFPGKQLPQVMPVTIPVITPAIAGDCLQQIAPA